MPHIAALPPTEYTGQTIAVAATIPFLLVVGTILTATFWRMCRKRINDTDTADHSTSDGALYFIASITFGFLTIATAVATWLGMYPWDAEYHEWRAVAGEVATVDSRLAPRDDGGRGMEEKYVVTFTDNPEKQYGVLDTRAATLKPGDQLTITCVRRWQWSGTHGFDCNFVSYKPAR